jgi:low affinity Fe/Cu permease
VDSLTAVTLAIFIVGLVYQAGRLAARIDKLEEWRKEFTEDMSRIEAKIDELLERRSRDRHHLPIT